MTRPRLLAFLFIVLCEGASAALPDEIDLDWGVYLPFVLDTEGELGMNLGIGRGLTSATDRWTLKAIFSF